MNECLIPKRVVFATVYHSRLSLKSQTFSRAEYRCMGSASSVQLKMVSMCSRKPICAPPGSEKFPMVLSCLALTESGWRCCSELLHAFSFDCLHGSIARSSNRKARSTRCSRQFFIRPKTRQCLRSGNLCSRQFFIQCHVSGTCQ